MFAHRKTARTLARLARSKTLWVAMGGTARSCRMPADNSVAVSEKGGESLQLWYPRCHLTPAVLRL
jgi:hypothetical protein